MSEALVLDLKPCNLSTNTHTASKMNSSAPFTPAQNPVGLPPETYYWRWDEFRNVVNMSYSTPDDDDTITVYDVSEKGDLAWNNALWCPLQCAGMPFEAWQHYSERKQDAIRMGFMRGLCEMIDKKPPQTLAEWRDLRPETRKPVIYDRYFNPITEEACRTRDYAKGQAEIEGLLKTIYAAGVELPYHPNFEIEFTAHVHRVPLSGLTAFLDGFSRRKGLANSEGYAYLLDVVTDATITVGPDRPEVVSRTMAWLRAALGATEPLPPRLAPPLSKKRLKEDAQLVKIKLEELEALFLSVVAADDAMGTWAAAITALRATDCLLGSDPAVHRWAQNKIAPWGLVPSRQTLNNMHEQKEANQFKDRHQRRVFAAIEKAIRKRIG